MRLALIVLVRDSRRSSKARRMHWKPHTQIFARLWCDDAKACAMRTLSQSSICRSSVNLTNYSTLSTEPNLNGCIPQHSLPGWILLCQIKQHTHTHSHIISAVWPLPLAIYETSSATESCIENVVHFGLTVHLPKHRHALYSFLFWTQLWAMKLH